MEISDDVAFLILSKLPLKSVKRFTSVHKSWSQIPNSLITTNLLSKHHSFYSDASLLLFQEMITDRIHYRSSLSLLSGDKLEKRVQLDWPPFQENETYIMLLGSGIHGTLCLELGPPDNRFVLWNPVTKEFTITPSPRPSPHGWDPFFTTQGFGYDPLRDDFMVLRNVIYFSDSGIDYVPIQELVPAPDDHWEIYSLRSNSWRKLDSDMSVIGDCHAVRLNIYTNGVCHWLGRPRAYRYGFDRLLGSFDFSNEVFFTTLLPLDTAERRHKRLLVLNESVAVISKHEEEATFHISILGELGVKESWTKLFIVEPLLGVGLPIGVGKKGELFFREENGELVSFDLSTQMLHKMGVKGLSNIDQVIMCN